VPAAISITDPADPRIAVFRDIRERDLVGRQGLFIAEGEVVLRTLLQSERHRPKMVLIDERRLEGLAPLLEGLGDAVPVYVAARGVLDGIAGFPLHRGILAAGECGPPLAPAELLAPAGPRVVLVLSGIANHDNLGGIFRNAAAFGAAGILLDADCCDPFYRKAIRVSVGTTLTLPFAKLAPGDDIVDLLHDFGYETLALSPAGSEGLAAGIGAPRTAVLLGTEGPGLPAELLARARSVRIPMAEGVDSLNVATTSGIVLFALSQAAR
jgi:tRNA G18 (ribose-2'-O)-methylase SpoU